MPYVRMMISPVMGGIGPCRVIGDIKEVIKEAILDGRIPNDYGAAFELMEQLAADYGLVKVPEV